MQNNSKKQTNRDLTGTLSRLADKVLTPRTQPGRLSEANVERIVVIKPCCLGDMLMATPVLRALAQNFPKAGLAVVTDEWTEPAIETSPRVDQLLRYPAYGALRSALKLGWQLRAFRFDLGISLDRSPTSALAMSIAGIPIRAGIDSSSRGIGLTHRATPEDSQHETDLYLSVLRTIDLDFLTQYPEYHVPDDALRRVSEIVPIGSGREIAVIHPGGAVNPGVAMLEKRWPATNYGELASLLGQEADVTVVLVGAESDQAAVDTVREFARSPVIDLCGQLSLPELAAITRSASLYVGNDSGTTHLASAVGTPVVAIFGPTNPNRYRPLGRRTRICAPEESWSLPDPGDLRNVDRAGLPDIAAVPLPTVLNACLELLGGAP